MQIFCFTFSLHNFLVSGFSAVQVFSSLAGLLPPVLRIVQLSSCRCWIVSYFNEHFFNSATTLSSLLTSEPGALGGVDRVRDLHVIGGGVQRVGVRIHQ